MLLLPHGGSRGSAGGAVGILPELFLRKRAIVRYRIHRLTTHLLLGLPPAFVWQIGVTLRDWEELIADVRTAQRVVVYAIKDRYPFLLRAPMLTRQWHVFYRTLKELERAQHTPP